MEAENNMADITCKSCSVIVESRSSSNGLCKKCYHKSWYEKNKEKKLAQNRAWELNNKEKRKIIKTRTNTKNRLSNREKGRKRYQANKEQLRQKSSEYKKNHPEKIKDYKREYGRKTGHAYEKSRRFAGHRTVSKQFRQELVDFCKNTPEGYHVDHIIPLKGKEVCGLHVPWNLQYLTKSENCKKLNSFDGTYENNGWSNK
jgi:hypothetical protein